MLKHLVVAATVLIVSSPMAHADLEDDLQSRWTGAWLIVNSELYSDCNGATTDNRMNGDLISGRGRQALPAGELGQVRKINVKRRRVDITLDLEEGVLIAYQDGPFTLYREASCRVELIMDFGEQRTRELGVEGIEARFASWFDRHARLAHAKQSDNWNQRERREYPDDYEQTLAEYRLWKVEQHNRLVGERIEESIEESRRLLAEVRAEDDFGVGLSDGIAAMRKNIGNDCAHLLVSDPDTYRQAHDAPSELWAKGYETGQHLAYYIELGRLLGNCYMEADDLPTHKSFSSR